jgi:hypothetical protein
LLLFRQLYIFFVLRRGFPGPRNSCEREAARASVIQLMSSP